MDGHQSITGGRHIMWVTTGLGIILVPHASRATLNLIRFNFIWGIGHFSLCSRPRGADQSRLSLIAVLSL